MKRPAVWISLALAAFGPQEILAPFIALGADDSYAPARRRMVAEQLLGPGRDITNARVLAAMGKVPRHEFVPERLRSLAYQDSALPIGHDQTPSHTWLRS